MSKVSDEDVPDIKTGLFRNTCSWLAVSPVITWSKCSFSCNLRTEALRKPAGRLGVVSACERSENKEGVWGRGVVDIGAFFGRNRRCLGCRF